MKFMKNKNFFDINIWLLKVAGLWIPDQGESLPTAILLWIYNIIVTSFCILFFLPCEFVAFQDSIKALEDAIKNASVASVHLLAGFKVYVWLRSRKEILGIIKELQEKAKQYEAIDDFKPEEMIEKEKKTKNFTVTVFVCLCLSVSFTAFTATSVILFTDYEKFEEITVDEFTNTTQYRYTQKLPYWAWVPFNTDRSRLRYFIGVVYTCFSPYQQAWVISSADTIFTALVSYISVQLNILQGAFKTIRPRCLKRLNLQHVKMFRDTEPLNQAMMQEMNKCIDHLQLIFKTCQTLESIYTYLTLAQVIISEISICTCLYLVSSIPMTSKAFATELLYLLAIEFQIALYCFFGNKVTATAEGVSLALYEGDWLSSSAAFKKSMILTMTRMSKPIHLTMGKFSPLTLSTFVTIARGSYSFFAVIKNQNK